jgi:hypothetical protein
MRILPLDARSDHAQGVTLLLCELSKTNPAYAKYPQQPVFRCEGFTQNKAVTDEKEP